jgi:hypothetical protein
MCITREVERVLRAGSIDAFVGFKALEVSPDLLSRLRMPKIHYHPDDSSNPVNRSTNFEAAEQYWDAHVTTKSFNVNELGTRTGKAVLYVKCAYDPRWHRPVARRKYEATFGFIGTRRPDREQLICDLSHRLGEDFTVAGAGWSRLDRFNRQSTVTGPVYGTYMAQLMADVPVQLGLLNSDNRDLHTCRSLEIPACGAVFLGERTREHAELFEDGVSGLLFGSREELLDQIDKLKSEPALANKIREKGLAEIEAGAHTYQDRAREILSWAQLT